MACKDQQLSFFLVEGNRLWGFAAAINDGWNTIGATNSTSGPLAAWVRAEALSCLMADDIGLSSQKQSHRSVPVAFVRLGYLCQA